MSVPDGAGKRPDRPVRPRDAASLVLLRRDSDGTRVLMGRRARQHRFLPGMYVFPGGRVERADATSRPATPLARTVLEKLCTACRPARAQALAVAAVRETYEETGLALGRIEARGLSPALGSLDYIARAITPSESPIRFHARFFLADASGCSGQLAGNGELLDLCWLTPEEALRLPVADVTEFVLDLLRGRIAGSPQSDHVPLFAYRKAVPQVRRG